MEEKIYCSHCRTIIDTDDYEELDGQIFCSDCIENYTTICDCCGDRIWSEEAEGDDYTTLCNYCYENHYTHCSNCDCLIHENDVYNLQDEDYCRDCYENQNFIFYRFNSHHFLRKCVIFYGAHTIISVISIAFSLA